MPFESPTHAITPDRQDAVVIEPVPNVSIQTGLGGLFYLVNLGIYLGLYGDFASPLRPGIALSIYDFVALVGQRLVSSITEDELDADRDPVWGFLLRLAGRREDEAPCAEGLGAPLDEWLDGLMPQIRDRLNRALGLTGEDPSELPRLLLVHPARVTVSGTHLDVFLSLNDLPISIRLSGLDRNPGWVPAAGRFIAFHFE